MMFGTADFLTYTILSQIQASIGDTDLILIVRLSLLVNNIYIFFSILHIFANIFLRLPWRLFICSV